MKVIVSFSGGKDSLASLLWVRNNLTKDFITVFCDTGWEHPLTYKYIEEVQEQLGLNLITVKSKKFNGMVDLTKKKSRWPSSQRRFCTSELKTIPMIDYILDEVNDDVLIIQGIRAAESAKRAEMSKQCTYFKYYVQPYGKDKNGKDKYHTYRRKDVLAFRKKYADDLLRPVFDWSAQQVIDYILENGIQPNPLYRMGYKRVGCFPCVMASQQDIYNISVHTLQLDHTTSRLGQMLTGSVPVIGQALSGAADTVLAGLQLLKSSLGIAALVILGAEFVPLYLGLLFHLAVLSGCRLLCSFAGIDRCRALFDCLTEAVRCMAAVTALFFSLTMVGVALMTMMNGG